MAEVSKKDRFIAQFMKSPVADFNSYQQGIREQALQALTQLEFPTLRDEAWKYTRITRVLNGNYAVKETHIHELPKTIDKLERAHRLVFVNGTFQPELSEIYQEEGVTILTLAQARIEHFDVIEAHYGKLASPDQEIFTVLNTAFNHTGVFVHIAPRIVHERPIEIVEYTTGDETAYQPRNLFVVEKEASASVVIRQNGEQSGSAFVNALTEVFVGEQANIRLYTLQENGPEHTLIHDVHAYQASNSTFHTGTFTFDGKLTRNNLNIQVDGTGCQTNLYGSYLITEKQHVDNHTLVDHRKPHCESNENYKGILGGKATGVFNGKVLVRQEAQKTNAFQSNKNILLTDNASINSKPELEIYADDVKCSHGSTTGQLDPQAYFYLLSRGIDPEQANTLLIQAFLAEVLHSIDLDELRAQVESRMNMQPQTLSIQL